MGSTDSLIEKSFCTSDFSALYYHLVCEIEIWNSPVEARLPHTYLSTLGSVGCRKSFILLHRDKLCRWLALTSILDFLCFLLHVHPLVVPKAICLPSIGRYCSINSRTPHGYRTSRLGLMRVGAIPKDGRDSFRIQIQYRTIIGWKKGSPHSSTEDVMQTKHTGRSLRFQQEILLIIHNRVIEGSLNVLSYSLYHIAFIASIY